MPPSTLQFSESGDDPYAIHPRGSGSRHAPRAPDIVVGHRSRTGGKTNRVNVVNDEHDEELGRARINCETAKIAWTELQRFFARGVTVSVSPDMDLVDVAYQASIDNNNRIGSWLESDRLGRVTDAQAREWLEENALMWAVVVKPWVLVQPIPKGADQCEPNDLN